VVILIHQHFASGILTTQYSYNYTKLTTLNVTCNIHTIYHPDNTIKPRQYTFSLLKNNPLIQWLHITRTVHAQPWNEILNFRWQRTANKNQMNLLTYYEKQTTTFFIIHFESFQQEYKMASYSIKVRYRLDSGSTRNQPLLFQTVMYLNHTPLLPSI
jgi:hypothetical protein